LYRELALIISAPTDYREAARQRLPRFLFDYIDGGAVTEHTMRQNVEELASINLRQRVLCGVGAPNLGTEIMGQKWALPIALGPVGATGTYARRGEVQAARAASAAGIRILFQPSRSARLRKSLAGPMANSGRSSMF
jgi:L-lactate dehydrogenase (cytochrome)